MRAIPERLRGVFTTRLYTNTRLPLPSDSCFYLGLYKCTCLLFTLLRPSVRLSNMGIVTKGKKISADFYTVQKII